MKSEGKVVTKEVIDCENMTVVLKHSEMPKSIGKKATVTIEIKY